jgi:hypothetical protein
MTVLLEVDPRVTESIYHNVWGRNLEESHGIEQIH